MDRVRLGRALGYGTRHAAKTVAAVVEAAGAPAATADVRRASPEVRSGPVSERASAIRETAASRESHAQRRPVRTTNVGNGLKHLKRSVWQPLAVFSGALWLRVTGLFFGLIAFTVGAGAWRLRAGWHGAFPSHTATRFWLFAMVSTVFAYFAASSFVRANTTERRSSPRP